MEHLSINDGYSKLWYIFNAHMLAYINGADSHMCSRIIETIAPLYGLRCSYRVTAALIPIVESYFQRLETLLDEVNLSQFDVIGTSTYTTSLASSLFIHKLAKQNQRNIITVMGGGIFADDLALGSDNLNTLVEEYPYVDHIILGEGELLFLKLLEGGIANKRVISIADIQGETLDMAMVPIPDFTDFDLDNYFHLTIEGARSCPFECSFCSETIQWGGYRKKSKDVLCNQVIQLTDFYKNNAFFMGDSLMNPYIMTFSAGLLERKAKILYDGYLRADRIATNRDRTKVWARSGMYRARLGIESGSAHVLNLMHKQTTPEGISSVLKSLASAGIRTSTYWIVGFPGETEENFQETLEFIREHHRYIYELEAHPYYYYPYGQVGSRLYHSSSLYTEEVTNIIKFKVWDIASVQPTRQERYERLRRISKLAAELGLINIYTMEQRYQADDRWHLLHPLTVEVFKGTQLHRSSIKLPQKNLEVFSAKWRRPGEQVNSDPNTVACYRMTVHRLLDETILSLALKEIVRHNEMLHMGLQDGKYVAMPEAVNSNENKILFIQHTREESENMLEDLLRQLIVELAQGMRPEPGASMRCALLIEKSARCQVLLLVHQAIADPRGLSLLCEDLFRIYEQLSNDRDISLHEVSLSYTDFIQEYLATGYQPIFPADTVYKISRSTTAASSLANVSQKTFKEVTLILELGFKKRIFSPTVAQCNLTAAEILLGAMLRSIAHSQVAKNLVRFDVLADYRLVNKKLDHTVGAFGYLYDLKLAVLPEESLRSDLPAEHLLLRPIVLNERAFEILSEGRAASANPLGEEMLVLLNLEYCQEEPWLGGDEWIPQGFEVSFADQQLEAKYAMEIVPVILPTGIAVRLKYRGGVHTSSIIEVLQLHLAQEIEATLNYCEHYAAAKRFWLDRFSYKALASSLEDLGGSTSQVGEPSEGSVDCHIEWQVVAQIQSRCHTEISTILLAVYGILLSRLHGSEDVIVGNVLYGAGEVSIVPLRFHPFWNMRFDTFIRDVNGMITQMREYAPFVHEVLKKEQSEFMGNQGYPVIEKGFVAGDLSTSDKEILRQALRGHITDDHRGIPLVLEVWSGERSVHVQISYERSRFNRVAIERLAAYLQTMLANIARNTTIRLGDIVLESYQQSADTVSKYAEDTFRF